jgi:signal transduction histidine kinase
MMDRKAYITHNFNELFKFWFKRIALLGSGIFVSLMLLDFVSTPENFRKFIVYRITISSVLLVLFFLAKKYADRDIFFHKILFFIGVAGSAIAIELMILDFGGHQSSYYAGLILLGVCVICFVPAQFSVHLINALSIYCIYMFPILLTEKITDFRTFFTSNAFLIAVLICALFLRYLSEKRIISEMGLRFDLEQQQGLLEEQVKERTSQLSETVDNLEREIAEREKLEEKLLHAEKMKAVGTLTGGIAHEFNNILTTIIGYGELLQEKIQKDSPLRTSIDSIRQSAERAATLTQGLLAFSRKQIIDPQPVDLNEIVRTVENLLSKTIGEDIKLKTILADEDITVIADSGQLEQVLVNLATNARDVMPAGGLLIIETEIVEIDREFIETYGYGKPGMYALLSVTDSGPGMDQKTKERIFEPFFTTKEVGKGTGLGLSTVYGIIKQHMGLVHVDSEKGQGTKFKIFLPHIEAEVAEEESKDLVPITGGTERILLAEDDDDVRDLIRVMLEQYGYTVIVAKDGEEAVALIRENKEDVEALILDVIMPKKNGKEVYEEIKGLRPEMKALFISGYTAHLLHKKGILEEEVAFLHKPVLKSSLLRKVREVLDS